MSSLPLRAPPGVPSGSDLAAHAAIFGLLALTLRRGWRRRALAAPALGPFIATVAYGVLDELHQAFVPLRSPAGLDVAADAAGAAIALAFVALRSRQADPPGGRSHGQG